MVLPFGAALGNVGVMSPTAWMWSAATRCAGGVLLVATACGGAEATADFSSRVWQMEDGLPHNIVQALAQTRDGNLWVGTREGLARFDGLRFKTIELSPEARHPSVFALLEGGDGGLWVGTEGAGLFRLQNGTVTPVPAPNGDRAFAVYDLKRSGDSVWFATSQGVSTWTGSKLERRADYRNLVEALCVDPTGGVWLAGETLRRLNGARTNYPVLSGTLPKEVRRAYCDAGGTFWLATSNKGLTSVTGGAATYHHKADGPAGFVSVMLQDRTGVFWVGSYSGLSWMSDGQFINERVSDATSYQMYALLEDREGSVWVGSEEGLTRFTPRAFRMLTRREGLSLNRVVTTCASRDGSIWVGLHGGGLNHVVDGRIEALNKASGLSSDYVMALCEGRDGSLWAGTDYGSVLNHLQAGRITTYGPSEGFVTAVTTALVEDRDGTLWVGTRDGLHRLKDGQFKCYLHADGLSHDKINALCLAAAGGVWIGTAAGLTRWQDQRLTNLATIVPQLSPPILSLHEDAEGALWIGTKGDGLVWWQNGVARRFGGEEGLPSDSIYAVLEDARTNLWLNGSRGVFQVSKEEFRAVASGRKRQLNVISYGKADGILSSGQYGEVTQPAACRGQDGRMWFRTTQGVAVVDPEKIRPNLQPPPVVIEEVVADRKTVAEAPLLGTFERVLVPKGRGELEVRYTALSLRAAERNQFRYRLVGVAPDWVEAGARRTAYYSKVVPGHYVFEVMAANNDGLWNEAATRIELELEPHFWQTRSFLVTCVLLAVAAIAGIARYVTWRRVRRELERLEQQNAIEKERARIARDMHDELGAKLTRISFQGATAKRSLHQPEQAQQQIDKMSRTARELVSSLDEIVWAVDPENDSLDNLANYICRHASEFFDNSPVRCQFAIPTKLPHCRLATDVRHNVFLAVKEVLNNALKHAQASRLDLTITAHTNEFEILIADNGRGFVPNDKAADALKRIGHGLVNIRERLISIGGRMELESVPGGGTRIRFVVPLAEVPA